jgi:hypothetical protein
MSQVIPVKIDTVPRYDCGTGSRRGWWFLHRFPEPDLFFCYRAAIVSDCRFTNFFFFDARSSRLCFAHELGNGLIVIGGVGVTLLFVGVVIGSLIGKESLFVSLVIGFHLFSGGVFLQIILIIVSISLSSWVNL